MIGFVSWFENPVQWLTGWVAQPVVGCPASPPVARWCAESAIAPARAAGVREERPRGMRRLFLWPAIRL